MTWDHHPTVKEWEEAEGRKLGDHDGDGERPMNREETQQAREEP